MLAQTATEYAKRYMAALEADSLTQGLWHTERDGRQLACALGVIGDEVNEPRDCPAAIMPRWLAQTVPAFFDRQKQDDAFAWGAAFTAELARLDGNVPFSVIHDWHANTVCPLGIEAAEKRGRDVAPHKALQALHLRALGGEKIAVDEWRPILRNANGYAYANADAYADAYADADADAFADAYDYADAYAHTYANTYTYAYICADADAWKRLADGMVEALRRA